MAPKVSINIPAYNADRYLRRAIESALEQTEPDIEVVVIDDGSCDSTPSVVQSFSDKRLKFLTNDQNRGVSFTRNRAIEASCGEWIAPLDADDWYAPERIKNLLNIANAEQADLVADDLYFVPENSNTPDATLFCVDQENFSQKRLIDAVTFLESNRKPAHLSPHLGLTKPLIKREFLIQHNLKYDETLQLLEDFHLYMSCLVRDARFIIVPEPYYFYQRSRQGSTSSQQRQRLLEQKLRANLLLLQDENVTKKSNIFADVHAYVVETNREIEYRAALGAIREKGWIQTLREIIVDPKLRLLILKQLPEMIRRRLIA